METVLPTTGRGDGSVPVTGFTLASFPTTRFAATPPPPRSPRGVEFDRIMKLLARWDRKPRRPGSRFTPGRRQRWTFEETIVLLDKKLRAIGARRSVPPPDIEGGDRPWKSENSDSHYFTRSREAARIGWGQYQNSDCHYFPLVVSGCAEIPKTADLE